MTPGKYLAKIINYGVSESSTGKLRVEIQFGFKDNEGAEQKLFWHGYFTEKSLPITAKALVVCGLSGNDHDALAAGPSSGLLNMEAPVQIEVVNEEFEGKTRSKIAWVNSPGGAKFMEPKMAVQKLKGLGLGAAVAAARAETGIKAPPPPTLNDDESLPF